MERITTDRYPARRAPTKKRRAPRRRVDYYEPQAMVDGNAPSRRRTEQGVGSKIIGGAVHMWRSMVSVLFNKRLAFDKPLVISILLLLAVGLIMMYSASYAYAFHNKGNSTYFIQKQLAFAVMGLVAMFGVSTIPPHRLKGSSTWLLLGVCYLLLILVLFLPKIEGVHRWIKVFGTTFQPTEIAKFAAILWCAMYITDNYKQINLASYPSSESKQYYNRHPVKKWFYGMWQNFKVAVLPFGLILGPMLVLVVVEPHLSCTILLVLIIGTQMFVGGTRKAFFGLLGALAGLAGYLVIVARIVPYGQTRLDVWRDPFSDKLGDGWQNVQSLYAISSGGLFGVGIGNSKQKYLYIAEPQNDFIFAVICEELGLIGALLVISLFVFFVWRGFAVSLANPDRFCKLVGIGITSQIGFQMLLNICVVTNLVPNTGISLPFFSYGGTSLMMLLTEIGVLLAISRTSPNKVI